MSNNVSNVHSIDGTRYEQLVSDEELPAKFQRALYFNKLSKPARQLLFGSLGAFLLIFVVCSLRATVVSVSDFSTTENILWSAIGLVSLAISAALSLWIHHQEEILSRIRQGKYTDLFKV